MITLTLFEQSCFTLSSSTSTIVIDPGKLTSPESLKSIGMPTASLVSHIHGDHFSEDNLQALQAPVYTVSEVAAAITETSLIEKVITEGQTLAIEGTDFTVTATASNHGVNISAPVENVGFLLKSHGIGVYLLGDMAISTPPPAASFSVVLVPIGNMGYVFTPEEAANHIREIDWKGLTIPVHYTNSDPESGLRFIEYLGEDADVCILKPGESIVIE